MAKARFEYRGRERRVEDVQRRATQSGGMYDSYLIQEVRTLKVKEGEACLRILPPSWLDDPKELEKWGDGWHIEIYLHYGVGPDKAAYLCLDKMKGQPCPVCEARRDSSDPDEQDDLKPAWRAICWAIDRDNEKAGPQVWSMPVTLFREINTRSIDKKTNLPILIDAAGTDEKGNAIEGYDVMLTRVGTDIKTKYSGVEISRDSSPLHDDEALETRWLDYITEFSLPTILNYFDAPYIQKVLSGQTSAKRSERDDDDGGQSASRRRRPANEPAEESVDETPAPSRRRAAAPAEDPPEDPQPRRRRGEPAEEPVDETPAPRRRTVTVTEETEEEPAPTSRRRPVRGEDPPAEETAEEPGPSRQARAGLDRLRQRAGR